MPKPEVNRPHFEYQYIFPLSASRTVSPLSLAQSAFDVPKPPLPVTSLIGTIFLPVSIILCFAQGEPMLFGKQKRDDAFENKVRRPPNKYLFAADSDGIFRLRAPKFSLRLYLPFGISPCLRPPRESAIIDL